MAQTGRGDSAHVSGERGLELFDELDATDCAIIRRILAAVAGEALTPGPSPVPDGRGAEGDEGDGGAGGGLTLAQLLELVERAARGDRGLGAQLFEAMRGMAGDGNRPPECGRWGRSWRSS